MQYRAPSAPQAPALLWLAGALFAEIVAGWVLTSADATRSAPWPLVALGLHGLAASAAGCACGLWRSLSLQAFDRGAALAGAQLSAALPVLGVLGLCCVVLPAWSRLRPRSRGELIEIALPTYDLSRAPEPPIATTPRADVVRAADPVEARIRALTALPGVEAARAVPMLRLALSDEYEDVRLLAFALLEQREKKMRARIKGIEVDLEAKKDMSRLERAALLRALAYEEWELVHCGLVTGALELSMLQRAAGHAERAFAVIGDGSLSLLLARIALRLRQPLRALDWLRRAEQLGIAGALCAELCAEAAFALRRFDVVRQQLARVPSAQRCKAGLYPVASFWMEAS